MIQHPSPEMRDGVFEKEMVNRGLLFRWNRDLVGDLTLGVSIEDIMMIANSNGEARGADLSATKKRRLFSGATFLFCLLIVSWSPQPGGPRPLTF